MDPYECYISALLEERRKALPEPPKSKADDTQIPFNVSSTNSYVKSFEYLRQRKALKNQVKY